MAERNHEVTKRQPLLDASWDDILIGRHTTASDFQGLIAELRAPSILAHRKPSSFPCFYRLSLIFLQQFPLL